VQVVGVFVDAELDEIAAIVSAVGLDLVQLHGDEPPDGCARIAAAVARPVWKAIPIGSAADLVGLDGWPADALLLDAPTPRRGGVGARFDHELARAARERYPARRFVLAGGLDAANVAAAIARVQPWAVDVASGVESAPGIKDLDRVDAFVAAVRAVR
jgi:phosphoribosylanthranilate isomerase